MDWSFNEYELYCMSLNKFNIIEQLGEGSFGNVHLAEYKPNGRLYALKFVKRRDKALIFNGLKLSVRVKHHNLIQCYGYFNEKLNDKRYIISILEFFQGRDMYDVIFDNLTYDIKTILLQLVDGLSYLHDHGYVHRDVKLENIIINNNDRVKLVDYDFLMKIGSANLYICGTSYYISPEILNGEIPDHRTDLWSLGVTIYTMLAGYYPFDGQDDLEICSKINTIEPNLIDIPSSYVLIVEGLLQKSPSKRISLEKVSTILKGI